MKIFDFTVNTQDATIDDFNNAVDYLRYMDARSGWSNEGYVGEESPQRFDSGKQPLTFEEYENWIKAIYVFVERCIDFYPPTSNFLFPYRKFDMKKGLKHYLRLYIMIEFLKKQDSVLFAYDYYSDGLTRMEKELTSFVNVSKIIRAIIISYQSVVGFDINEYKNFGASFKMNDFFLDCFPFAGVHDVYDDPNICFSYMEYIIKDGKLYRMNKRDFCSNKKEFDAYLESHPESKKKFNKVMEEFDNNNKKIIEKLDKEIEKYSNINKDLNNKKAQPEAKLKQLADEVAQMNRKSALVCLFYVMFGKVNKIEYEASAYEQEINRIENQINNNNEQIKKLSLQKKEKDVSDVIREFILSMPDFLEYKEV